MSVAISAKQVSVSYDGQPAVEGVSFEIAAGEIAAIIGPNGSGKTTLLRALAGFLPFRGEIQLLGRDIQASRGRIGYIPQRLEIDRTVPITVREFLRLTSPECFTPDCQHRTLHQQLGIAEWGGRLLGELSGGQFQRVLVARALLEDPRILFLDEPASGIDAPGQETLYRTIRETSRQRQTTVVMASHEFDVVYQYAQQVLCLNKRLVCSGRPSHVLNEKNLRALYGAQSVIYSHQYHDHS